MAILDLDFFVAWLAKFWTKLQKFFSRFSSMYQLFLKYRPDFYSSAVLLTIEIINIEFSSLFLSDASSSTHSDGSCWSNEN